MKIQASAFLIWMTFQLSLSIFAESRFGSLGNVIFDAENNSTNTIIYDTNGQLGIGTTTTTNTLTLQGSGEVNGNLITQDLKTQQISRGFASVSNDYTITNERFVLVNTSADNIRVILPEASEVAGETIEIKKTVLDGYVDIVPPSVTFSYTSSQTDPVSSALTSIPGLTQDSTAPLTYDAFSPPNEMSFTLTTQEGLLRPIFYPIDDLDNSLSVTVKINNTVVGSVTIPSNNYSATNLGDRVFELTTLSYVEPGDVVVYSLSGSASGTPDIGIKTFLESTAIEKQGAYRLTRVGDSFGYAKFVSNGNEWFVLDQLGGRYSQKSISFDGVDDYVDLGPDNGFLQGDSFSISLWFRLNSTSGNQSFIGSYTASDEFLLSYVGSTGQFRVQVEAVTTSIDDSVAQSLATGNWYHYAVVVSDNAHMYLNGNLIHTTPNLVGDFIDTSGSIRLSDSGVGDSFLDGALDDVAIFSRALDADDIGELYNHGAPGDVRQHSQSSSLANYWPLGEADTTSNVQDVTFSGNHGTMVNGPVITGDVP